MACLDVSCVRLTEGLGINASRPAVVRGPTPDGFGRGV